jgi:hypothetical protein
MKRLFAAVAISALTLSTAAFAAETPAVQKPVDQKAQAPVTSTTTPAKPMVDETKKPAVKKDKTSLNAQRPATIQKAQAPGSATAAPAKTMTDGAPANGKKAETVKKSDAKPSSEPASTTTTTTTKPATR